jgi:hypothetical protein
MVFWEHLPGNALNLITIEMLVQMISVGSTSSLLNVKALVLNFIVQRFIWGFFKSYTFQELTSRNF